MGQKILWDCHMHSSFSADSETPMEDMIQTAVDKGLTGICFTASVFLNWLMLSGTRFL